MASERLLIRIPLGEIGYLLLRELEGGTWRLTNSRESEGKIEHELKHGTERKGAVDALADALRDTAVAHLARLSCYQRELLSRPGERPGFRPGRQQRALTRVANSEKVFLSSIKSCAAQAGRYLQEHGWPVPQDREISSEHKLVFYLGGLRADQTT
jgi:hypothetical protein